MIDRRDEDLRQFQAFVSASRWRFARTYVQSYPHEYTLANPGDLDAFRTAVLCIERWGVTESFWNTSRKYLHVDDRKYWHMGDTMSDSEEHRPTLINRAWLDVGMYRSDAQALGYEGHDLDRLVARWKTLLERAREGK
jgi:hypothetical protein